MKLNPHILVALFVFGLFSCGNDVKVITEQEDQTENTYPELIKYYEAELDSTFENDDVDDYYKEIYKEEKLIPADDSKMLSVTEKLFTLETENDFFYFVVFTKSMNGADGFFAEALGMSALKFVQENTERFAEFFSSNVTKLNEKDLDNWAYYVNSEIKISNEGKEKEAIKELEQHVNKKTADSDSKSKAVMEKFLKKLKSQK